MTAKRCRTKRVTHMEAISEKPGDKLLYREKVRQSRRKTPTTIIILKTQFLERLMQILRQGTNVSESQRFFIQDRSPTDQGSQFDFIFVGKLYISLR